MIDMERLVTNPRHERCVLVYGFDRGSICPCGGGLELGSSSLGFYGGTGSGVFFGIRCLGSLARWAVVIRCPSSLARWAVGIC